MPRRMNAYDAADSGLLQGAVAPSRRRSATRSTTRRSGCGVDRREVPHLDRLRRRRRAVVHQGPAARQPDGLLGHRDRALVGAPLLRVRRRGSRTGGLDLFAKPTQPVGYARYPKEIMRTSAAGSRHAVPARALRRDAARRPLRRVRVPRPLRARRPRVLPPLRSELTDAVPGRPRCSLAITADAPPRTPAARDDWRTLREQADTGLAFIDSLLPEHPEVARIDPHDHVVRRRRDLGALVRPGARPRMRADQARPAVVFLHGGGMILGSVAAYDRLVAGYVADSGCRSCRSTTGSRRSTRTPPRSRTASPRSSGSCTTPTSCGIDPGRASRSWATAPGAGWPPASRCWRAIAASRWPARCSCTRCSTTARRCPTPSSHRSRRGRTTTTTPDGTRCSATRSAPTTCRRTPAPARADDVSGLPPTYVDTGDLDIFRDEDIEYARRIAATGTTVELHVHPGCPHGFDRIPGLPVGQRATPTGFDVPHALTGAIQRALHRMW